MDKASREILVGRLTDQLSIASSPPFLFVGSGFSQRYLGLPRWSVLLEYFCKDIKPFKYYYTKADGDLPTVATLMADDYFEVSWKDTEKVKLLEKAELKTKEDVLKFFICKYIDDEYKTKINVGNLPEEVQKLENLTADSIITTNWDCYLEDIFPEYTTYIGQDEIVVSNPHGIGEIYKIHGSIKSPCSLVLTKEDYREFERKYAYLAAKLITYLIEHPIVFIGYSLRDENIKKIIESLASCLGTSVHDCLRNNLIFVQRNGRGRVEGIETTQFKVYDHQVPLTTVTTDDFGIVYDAMSSIKRKIPARVLRFLKDELYDIVKTNDPKGKLYAADIDELCRNDDVEFVVGVGVKSIHDQGVEAQASRIGYKHIEIEEILSDVMDSGPETSRFGSIRNLLQGTIPFHLSRSANTPIFKYLRMDGIDSDEKYKTSRYSLDKAFYRPIDKFKIQVKSYTKAAEGRSITEIIQDNTPQNAAYIIPQLDISVIDVDELKAFISTYKDEWNTPTSRHRSAFRKLVTIYDRLKYGWIDFDVLF
jgi:hypothetical protein